MRCLGAFLWNIWQFLCSCPCVFCCIKVFEIPFFRFPEQSFFILQAVIRIILLFSPNDFSLFGSIFHPIYESVLFHLISSNALVFFATVYKLFSIQDLQEDYSAENNKRSSFVQVFKCNLQKRTIRACFLIPYLLQTSCLWFVIIAFTDIAKLILGFFYHLGDIKLFVPLFEPCSAPRHYSC